MNEIYDWLLQLPQTFGNFLSWLNEPINIGSFQFTPLGALGGAAVGFIGVIIVLKIKSLILA